MPCSTYDAHSEAIRLELATRFN